MGASAPEVQAYDAAFDQIALALAPDANRTWASRAAIQIDDPIEPGLEPLSAEGVLFGLWDRLGSWVNDTSYCTWAGLAEFGFPRPPIFFRLTLSEGAPPPDAGDRRLFRIGATAALPDLPTPREPWLLHRELYADVPMTRLQPQPEDTAVAGAEDVEEFAALAFQQNARAFVDSRRFGEFARIVGECRGGYVLAPIGVLARTVEALAPRDPAAAAEAISCFVTDALPRMPQAVRSVAIDRLATLAVSFGLTARLAPPVVQSLAETLFAPNPAGPDLAPEIERALATARPADHDWRPLLAAVTAHDDGRLGALRGRLIALAWAHPDGREAAREAMTNAIIGGEGPGVILPILELQIGPPAARAEFFTAFAPRVRKAGRRDGGLATAGWSARMRLLRIGAGLAAARRRGAGQ
jgi:hypothetical protein